MSGPRRIFRFHELFRIERFAHENVQDFARARNAVADDLRVVDVELGFAVAPVTVVLEQGGSELREARFGDEESKNASGAKHCSK